MSKTLNEQQNTKEQAEQDLYILAASWVEKLASGELDSLSKRRFSHWLAADPKHRELLQSMVVTWNNPALTKALAAYQPSPLKKWQNEIAKWRFASAAVVTVSIMFLLFNFNNTSLHLNPEPYDLKTAQTTHMQQKLDDGSVVDIAANSQLTIFFNAEKRQVLQGLGEAYFAVAKDQNRPFEVRLDQAIVKAVGTEFNIDRDPNLIDITVYEGAVQVQATASGPRQLLKAGERVRIQHNKISEVQKVPLQHIVDWRSGWIEIEDETLSYLLHRLNRSATIPVSAAIDVANLRVAGRFELANTQQTLQALTEAYGLTLHQTSQGIRLSRSH